MSKSTSAKILADAPELVIRSLGPVMGAEIAGSDPRPVLAPEILSKVEAACDDCEFPGFQDQDLTKLSDLLTRTWPVREAV